MKVSASGRSSNTAVPLLTARRAVLLGAALYLAAHLPFLAPSLEDIDSINFALGLRDYDIAQHQPHPPGYPVYIAMGRASLALVRAVAPAFEQARAEALALAIWSAAAGAAAVVAAWMLFVGMSETGRRGPPYPWTAVWGALLLAVAPLFWMAGLRPLSDMPGLAAALISQALLVAGLRNPRALVAGAFIGGLAVGIRSQALMLVAPLWAVAIAAHWRAGVLWIVTRPVAAMAAGGIAWGVPLLVTSGGLDGYLAALGTQAGEDFAWVDMVWANPSPRRVAFALHETFVLPWGAVWLAVAALTLAVVGVGMAAVREPRALSLLSVAFVPYGLFHLLFQETLHVRYALPLLAPVAWLAARGAIGVVQWRHAPAALVAAAAVVALPGAMSYGREPHPAFRAIADVTRDSAAVEGDLVFSHFSLRRPLQAQPPANAEVVEAPRTAEWMGPVRYWRDGGSAPVWFLADPRRTDLALIDPHANRRAYAWAVADRLELSGTRPLGVDLYRFERPGWFAGEGWSLTPEVGGVTRATGTGLDRRPIEAYVRRRSEPMHLVIGGRHLGTGSTAARITLTIDGQAVDTWTFDTTADGLNFLRFVPLPAGIPAGSGDYARLVVSAAAAAPGGAPAIAIRQFDVQPASVLVHGFGDGWHEEEFDNTTGLRWRWTSDRSVLRVAPPQAVRLTLRGESPLAYFDAPPRVRVVAGGRVAAEMRPADDFRWVVDVPAGSVREAGGAIAIETDPVYLPGQAEGTSDVRRLGVRLFEIAVNPVQP